MEISPQCMKLHEGSHKLENLQGIKYTVSSPLPIQKKLELQDLNLSCCVDAKFANLRHFTVTVTRIGLIKLHQGPRLISHKVSGFGAPDGSSVPESRQEQGKRLSGLHGHASYWNVNIK